MPAPLAKGLILTISLLCAAGLAAYENPHVRQWIDESRRKVAIALHSLGDELAPEGSSGGSSQASPDPSTREDEDPEAVERRRKARQEILERGRRLEEKRKSKQGNASKAKSFDDLVDKDGSLKKEETIAITTAAEPQIQEPGLRHRHTESQAAGLGSAFANPFGDETNIDSPATLQEDSASRSRTPTLPDASPASPPVPPKPAAYQPQRLLIDTEEISNHPSEQLVDLTPTTSTPSVTDEIFARLNDPSANDVFHCDFIPGLASSDADFSFDPRDFDDSAHSEPPPEIQAAAEQNHDAEEMSQMGSEDFDVLSESDDGAGISTPDSWTEAGSLASNDR